MTIEYNFLESVGEVAAKPFQKWARPPIFERVVKEFSEGGVDG